MLTPTKFKKILPLTKKFDLINSVMSNEVPSPTQKILQQKEIMPIPARESFPTLDDTADPLESEGNVAAIV